MTFSSHSPFCPQKTFSRRLLIKLRPWWFSRLGPGSVKLWCSSKTSKLKHKPLLKRRCKRRRRPRPKRKLKCKSRRKWHKWIWVVSSWCLLTQLQHRKLFLTNRCLTSSSVITLDKRALPHSRTSLAWQTLMEAWVVRWASTWTQLTKCTKCRPTHRCSNSLPRTNWCSRCSRWMHVHPSKPRCTKTLVKCTVAWRLCDTTNLIQICSLEVSAQILLALCPRTSLAKDRLRWFKARTTAHPSSLTTWSKRVQAKIATSNHSSKTYRRCYKDKIRLKKVWPATHRILNNLPSNKIPSKCDISPN